MYNCLVRVEPLNSEPYSQLQHRKGVKNVAFRHKFTTKEVVLTCVLSIFFAANPLNMPLGHVIFAYTALFL